MTGEAFQYTNWDTNEPNNLNGELYAEATGGFRWNDDGATVTNFYFVEFGTPAGNVATPEPVALAFAIPVLGVMAGRRPWRNKR